MAPRKRNRKPAQMKVEQVDSEANVAPSTSLQPTALEETQTQERRRSSRKRTPKRSAEYSAFSEKEINDAMRLIDSAVELESQCDQVAVDAIDGSLNGIKEEGSSGQEQNSSPANSGSEIRRSTRSTRRTATFANMISDSDIDIDIYDDDVEDKNFEGPKIKLPPPNKRGRKRVPSKQAFVSFRRSAPSEDEDKEEQNEDNERFAAHIRAPRSKENYKYQEVYETIPKLRSVSPPRFTTKGVEKKKLNCEELGVRIVGKTVGNPFSNYSKKRNGIIYGNQSLKTIEEMEKFTGAAFKVKKVLKQQSAAVRLSSYVQPEMLQNARKKHVKPKCKIKAQPDEDVDVDIETVDDNVVCLEPEAVVLRPKKRYNLGRKPGRTILECGDCGYKTTHSGHMKIHIVCVHKDVKLLECQYTGCGYKCARKGSMTRHEKCVHRKDRVFKCEQCPFQSAWSISLERHIITKHEKLRPWSCQLCDKSFGQQFTLTQHLNTVHKKMKRIRCAFCAFRSSTKVSVRSHILRMHKEEIAKAVNEVEENSEKTDKTGEVDDDKMITTEIPTPTPSEASAPSIASANKVAIGPKGES